MKNVFSFVVPSSIFTRRGELLMQLQKISPSNRTQVINLVKCINDDPDHIDEVTKVIDSVLGKESSPSGDYDKVMSRYNDPIHMANDEKLDVIATISDFYNANKDVHEMWVLVNEVGHGQVDMFNVYSQSPSLYFRLAGVLDMVYAFRELEHCKNVFTSILNASRVCKAFKTRMLTGLDEYSNSDFISLVETGMSKLASGRVTNFHEEDVIANDSSDLDSNWEDIKAGIEMINNYKRMLKLYASTAMNVDAYLTIYNLLLFFSIVRYKLSKYESIIDGKPPFLWTLRSLEIALLSRSLPNILETTEVAYDDIHISDFMFSKTQNHD